MVVPVGAVMIVAFSSGSSSSISSSGRSSNTYKCTYVLYRYGVDTD